MTVQYATPWLQPAKFIRNGKYPDSLLQADLAGLANHIALYRMKEIARFGMNVGSLTSPTTTSRVRWRTQYVASPHVRAVVVMAWVAKSEPVSLEEFEVFDPTVVFSFDDGTDVHTAEIKYGAATTESADPNDCAAIWTFVRSATTPADFWQPVSGSVNDVTITDFRSRVVSATIYEVPFGIPAPFVEGYAAGTPILDADRQALVEYARLAWKTQAAPLLTWTLDDQASPRSTTSDTQKNLVDDTSTTVTGATPGYTLDLRHRARVSTGTVSCRLSAYGSSTDVGYVRLRDSGGAVVAGVEINSPTPGWFAATCEMPATLAKYDIHYDSTSGETTEVSAVHLEQWSSGV